MKILKYQYGNPIEEWSSKWKDRLQPSARSKVLQKWNATGKKPKPESSKEYTKRRIKEETKRTWRSDAADIAHGIGEGVLALHPYTAIPYYGAKVGQDFLNGNLNWSTALNASVPLFHMAPQAVGLREATNVALEDAANAGSKTARNWRIAREINQATKSKPNIEVPKPIIRTKIGDVEIDNPNLLYHLDRGNGAGAFSNQGAYVENGFLFPGTPKDISAIPYSWWNKGKPYATNVGRTPMTRLMTATEDAPGMLHVRSQNYPIGQWNGKRGFVTNAEYVNPEGVNVLGSIYNWKPGYGYKKIVQEPSTSLKFFERPSKISEAERVEVPRGERNQLFKSKQLVPLKSQSPSKFVNPDNTINVNNSVEAIKEGKNWAVQYLQSEAKKQTNQHNLQLAQKIGLKLFRPFNEASQRVAVPNKIKIINERGNMEGGSVWTDSKNPALDETTINVSQNPYYSSLHENLHRGYVGNAPKEYYLNEPRGTFGDTNKFYEWLKEKTLKPWTERHNLPGAEYLDKPEELAVNLIEAGQRMGLKIGQQYPGKQKALELMEKYRLSGDYKSGVIDLLNLKKPKRAWKGLTGTLFSLPFIYGYNSNGQKNIQ